MVPYALLALSLMSLRQVPPGMQLHVRLATPIGSFASKTGMPVSAVLIAPVVLHGEIVLPEGAALNGTVTRAQSVGFGIEHETAGLQVDFDTLVFPNGFKIPVATRLLQVDNGREQVMENGMISGVRTTSSISYRASGYIRMALALEWHASLALWAAKMLVVQVPEPEIYYPAGSELTLALADTTVSMAQPDNEPRLTEEDSDDLRELTARMPYRAYAVPSNRPSDLMNILLVGSRDEIEAAFLAAGWTRPSAPSLRARIRGIRAVAERQSDAAFPMSKMIAGDRAPDMSWQKGLNDVRKRHHVRIWKQDATWNGQSLWIAAATRDIDFTFLRKGSALTHRIARDLDGERDKIAHDLAFTSCTDMVDWWDRPGAPTAARNATGDLMETDGELAVIKMNRCAAPRSVSMESEPLRSRPGFAKRLVRREILSIRSDFYRTNPYWRTYEATRWMVLAIKHRHNPEPLTPAEKTSTVQDGFLVRAKSSSWFR